MYTTKTIDKASITNTIIDFGFNDDKGRRCGFNIEFAVATFVESEGRYGYPIDPGTYIQLETQTTRAGKRYGACQPYFYAKTPEEAQAEATRRTNSARKSYERKFLK